MYNVYVNNTKMSVADFITMLNDYTIKNENEIWIFDDSKKYPCLSLLLNNDNAAVHYFENKSDVGCISFNKKTLSDNECVLFNDICLDKKHVINRTEAVKCITQFILDAARPSCIEWFEL